MKRFFAVLISVVFSVISLMAQDEILVMGKVISTVEDEPLSGVQIFVFKTVGAGKYEYDRAKIMYEDGYVPEGAFREERSMTDGTFEFNAQPGGALLFYQFPFKPEFVKIGGKNKIPTVKIEATTVLDEATLPKKERRRPRKESLWRMETLSRYVSTTISMIRKWETSRVLERKLPEWLPRSM